MKTKIVPSRWITTDGRRLDARPHLSGAREACELLERLKAHKDKLYVVTQNGIAGIYHAGREGRTYVDSPEHGVPFLSSSDVLTVDLSHLPFIAKRQVQQTPKFVIREGMTLITRSGTIGRMVYCRPEMDGLACSEHVMRVVPDPAKVPPGYLYAFLSSKFGVPLVIGGTYGSIIQSIEPEHIKDLPVPRLGKKVEEAVHGLIDSAGKHRQQAAKLRSNTIKQIEQELEWSRQPLDYRPTHPRASTLTRRLDAFHHSRSVASARECLSRHSSSRWVADETESVFEPNRGARLKVEDERYGVPFLSSSEVFSLDPQGDYLISRRMPHFESLLLKSEDLLLPRSGQLGGVIGRAILPLPTNYGNAATEHLVRVRCRTHKDALYLWAVFASEPGYYATIGTAFGSSIPSLDCDLISDLRVPWIEGLLRKSVVASAEAMLEHYVEAIKAERAAIGRVEQTIEAGGT